MVWLIVNGTLTMEYQVVVTSMVVPCGRAQLEVLTVSLSVPYSNVQWLASNWALPQGTTMDVTTTWYSMVNVPLTISQTIPGSP
jgi:hypothetical protein